MPTKYGTFTFTIPIKILERRQNVSLAVAVNKQFNDKEVDIIEINHHETTFKPPLTEHHLQPNTLLTATISILNGRGHALTIKPFTESRASVTKVE